MGLTIHYQGQLRSEEAFTGFIAAAQAFAEARQWPVHTISKPKRELVRMLQPEDPDADEVEEVYLGPTRGLYLLPHPECEPLPFEFDRDLFMQDTCKTQFAGPEIHAAIVQLLRETEPLFDMLDVQDEAGFWEVPESEAARADLNRTFLDTRAAIQRQAIGYPGSSIAVLTPSGRILDILAQ